ncbi:hypothetical protein TWF694_005034 [Orbilia ellipsospora]|uniref:Uncharacterized protein n=1 Tax=Orbilia ellipsospora TaxID=2528407 RepID=A0AAV9WVE9_9PEZI
MRRLKTWLKNRLDVSLQELEAWIEEDEEMKTVRAEGMALKEKIKTTFDDNPSLQRSEGISWQISLYIMAEHNIGGYVSTSSVRVYHGSNATDDDDDYEHKNVNRTAWIPLSLKPDLEGICAHWIWCFESFSGNYKHGNLYVLFKLEYLQNGQPSVEAIILQDFSRSLRIEQNDGNETGDYMGFSIT